MREHTTALLLESIPDPAGAFDLQFRCTSVSLRTTAVLGRTPEEMIGQSLWELFPYGAGTGCREACPVASAHGKPVTAERYSNVLDT